MISTEAAPGVALLPHTRALPFFGPAATLRVNAAGAAAGGVTAVDAAGTDAAVVVAAAERQRLLLP
jgi:hypothetical protein